LEALKPHTHGERAGGQPAFGRAGGVIRSAMGGRFAGEEPGAPEAFVFMTVSGSSTPANSPRRAADHPGRGELLVPERILPHGR